MTATYTKRESEIILVSADFSDLLADAEDVSSCDVAVYVYGGADFVSEDFSLNSSAFVALELVTGGEATLRKAFPASGFSVARLVLLSDSNSSAVSGMITDDSLSDGHVSDLKENVARIRIQSGTAGLTYRIVFTATTTFSNKLMLSRTLSVEND